MIKFKKKMLAVTLAASVSLTTLSGLPLSNGWLNQSMMVEAALPESAAGLLDKMDEWYGVMPASDLANLAKIKAELGSLSDSTHIFEPIWSKISSKIIASGEIFTYLTKDNVSQTSLSLITALLEEDRAARSIALDLIRTGETSRGVLQELALLSGHEEGLSSLSLADLETFLAELEQNVINAVQDVESVDELRDAQGVLRTVISQTLQHADNVWAGLLRETGVNANDLLEVKNRLEAAVDPEQDAFIAFAMAFLKLHIIEEDPKPTPAPGIIPPSIPPAPAPVVIIGDVLEGVYEVEAQFAALVGNIAESQTETEAVLAAKAAIELVKQTIREVGTIDVTAAIEVEDGVATTQLPADELIAAIEEVMAAIGIMNEALRGIGLPQAEVELTLDFGEVEADEIRVALEAEVLEAARTYGVDRLNLKVNGVELLLSPQEFAEDTELVIRDRGGEELQDEAGAWVTPVYEIQVFENGQARTSFNQPIKWRLPVPNVDGVDPERLTLVKLDGDTFQLFGGKYDADQGKFVAERNALSSYAVLENEVTFDDLGGTAEWAGRAIEVSAAKGIISGRAEGEFDPRANVTRAEFATLLVQLFGIERPGLTTNEFEDVASDAWYMPFIAAAVEEGLIYGRGDGTFDPSAHVTRVEMSVMASRALQKYNRLPGLVNRDTFLGQFEDTANIFQGMKDDTALAIRENIMQGHADGSFDPNGNSTRAEAAVVIYNLLNQYDLD